MSSKVKVIVAAVALVASYGAGRWSAPTKVVTQTVTKEVEKKQEQVRQNTDQDKHKVVTVKQVIKPDGSQETDTTTTEDITTNKQYQNTTQTKIDESQSTTKEVTRDTAKVTVMALGVVNVTSPTGIDYGIGISKPILGPLSVGLMGFESARVGLQIGLTF